MCRLCKAPSNLAETRNPSCTKVPRSLRLTLTAHPSSDPPPPTRPSSPTSPCPAPRQYPLWDHLPPLLGPPSIPTRPLRVHSLCPTAPLLYWSRSSTLLPESFPPSQTIPVPACSVRTSCKSRP